MAGATQISEFVEQLRSEAEFDSMGEFTLAVEQAIAKIRREAERTPSRCLLYAVQSAVALRAQSVRLSLSHQMASLELHFGQDRTWECFADSQSLISMPSGENQGLEDFRQALLWSRALQPGKVDVVFRGPHSGYILTFQGDESLVAVQPARTDGPPVLHLLLTFANKNVSRVAELSHGCAARLRFCPVPCYLDGLLLNTGSFQGQQEGYFCRYLLSSEQDSSWLAVTAPVGWPALIYAVGRQTAFERGRVGEPFPVVERLELQVRQAEGGALKHFRDTDPLETEGLLVARWDEAGHGHVLVLPGRLGVPLLGELRAKMVACRAYFYRAFEGENKLYIVQRGCTLSSLELPGLPADGWRVAITSNQVKTDLSGLTPIDNEDTDKLVHWTCGHILRIHAQLARSNR